MANARRPFRTVTVSAVLISREVLPIWLWERLNGRHDLLIVHVTFRHHPALEAEIIDPGNELGRRGELQAQEHDWLRMDLSPRWRLYHSSKTPHAHVQTIADYVVLSPFGPWRVALRRSAPHMLLNMPMPNLDQIHSRQLARMLTELARLAHSPSGERDP